MFTQSPYGPIAAILILSAAVANAQSEPGRTLTSAGTLTCTTAETPPDVSADAELSCSFRSPAGANGNFTGYIDRIGQADLPPGKRVLVWLVLAESRGVGLRELAGSYLGKTGGEPGGLLVGGEGMAIVLQPSTRDSQVGEVPVPTVLRLRLEPVRA